MVPNTLAIAPAPRLCTFSEELAAQSAACAASGGRRSSRLRRTVAGGTQ